MMPRNPVEFGTHPNCRCSAAPAIGQPDADGYMRSAPYTAGPDDFAKLTEAEQRAILGNKKYEAYKAGQIALEDMVAERDSAEWGMTRSEASLRQALENHAVRSGELAPPASTRAIGDLGGLPEDVRRAVEARRQSILDLGLDPMKIESEDQFIGRLMAERDARTMTDEQYKARMLADLKTANPDEKGILKRRAERAAGGGIPFSRLEQAQYLAKLRSDPPPLLTRRGETYDAEAVPLFFDPTNMKDGLDDRLTRGKEAAAWYQAKYGLLETDLTQIAVKLDPLEFQTFMVELGQLSRAFPYVPGSAGGAGGLKRLRTSYGNDPNAAWPNYLGVHWPTMGEIDLNPAKIRSGRYGSQNEDGGWSITGPSGPAAILRDTLVHEFGHAIASRLGFPDGWVFDWTKRVLEIKTRYGKGDEHEAWAEMFTAHWYGYNDASLDLEQMILDMWEERVGLR